MVSTHLPLGQSSLASPPCGVGFGFRVRGEGLSPTDRETREEVLEVGERQQLGIQIWKSAISGKARKKGAGV